MLGNKARLDVGGSIHLEGFQGVTAGLVAGKSRIS